MPKLSINLIIHSDDEAKYLPLLFESLKNQTFQDFEILVLENDAKQEVIERANQELNKLHKPFEITKSDKNLGFAGGHNALYKKTKAPYIMILNPDMYLMPNVLEKMIVFLDQHHETFAVSTRLMKWNFDQVAPLIKSGKELSEIAEQGFTNLIDAIGIRLLRNRRAVEWLTGEKWKSDSKNKCVRSVYNKSIIEVFGVSGALSMFRKDALDQVLLPGGNMFDPTYHSYKEDLDLAYRLRNMGFTSYVLLGAVGYHDRTGAGPQKLSDWATIKSKKKQAKFVIFHSYKNHLRTLYKNEYWQNFLLDFPGIFWFELKKFIYFVFTDPGMLFKAWSMILKDLSYTRSAKKDIKKKRRMYWKGLRKWFYV